MIIERRAAPESPDSAVCNAQTGTAGMLIFVTNNFDKFVTIFLTKGLKNIQLASIIIIGIKGVLLLYAS